MSGRVYIRGAGLARRLASERLAPGLALQQNKKTSANPGVHLDARVSASVSANLSAKINASASANLSATASANAGAQVSVTETLAPTLALMSASHKR